jgi:MFS family permease
VSCEARLSDCGGFGGGVGGVIFGHVGDKVGRKPALLISIGLMAFATFGVGCLPTYKQVGIFAPALLLVLRMIQV